MPGRHARGAGRTQPAQQRVVVWWVRPPNAMLCLGPSRRVPTRNLSSARTGLWGLWLASEQGHCPHCHQARASRLCAHRRIPRGDDGVRRIRGKRTVRTHAARFDRGRPLGQRCDAAVSSPWLRATALPNKALANTAVRSSARSSSGTGMKAAAITPSSPAPREPLAPIAR